MTNINYRNDRYLACVHLAGLLIAYACYYSFPIAIAPEKNLSGLFNLIVIMLGGVAGLITLMVALARLKNQTPYLRLGKFFLGFCYWISSSFIYIFISSTDYFHNQLSSIWFLVVFFFGSLYFSVLAIAEMHLKDYLFIIGLMLLIFCLASA